MHALVTGGTGFLMAHVAREWLAMVPAARVTLVASSPPNAAVTRYLQPLRDRVAILQGDVRCPDAWAGRIAGPVDHLVHGAAICPMPEGDDHSAERARLTETVEINVMGTLAMLDWARAQPGLRRVVNVSSGVYGYGAVAPFDAPPEPPIAEDAPLLPQDSTYDITKAAGEWLTGRFAALHGLDCVSVRPSAIFGPLDRDTPGRRLHPAPWHMARAALAGRGVTVNDPEAGYDWLYAPDGGRAIALLMAAPRLDHAAYNVSFGRRARLADLAEGIARVVPGFALTRSDRPEIHQPTDRRGGVWRPRSSARLEAQVDWRPTPLADAMAAYMRWLMAGGTL